jgi:hypothetical protein
MTSDLVMRMENPLLTQARKSLGLPSEPSAGVNVTIPYEMQLAQNELARELKKVQTNVN